METSYVRMMLNFPILVITPLIFPIPWALAPFPKRGVRALRRYIPIYHPDFTVCSFMEILLVWTHCFSISKWETIGPDKEIFSVKLCLTHHFKHICFGAKKKHFIETVSLRRFYWVSTASVLVDIFLFDYALLSVSGGMGYSGLW